MEKRVASISISGEMTLNMHSLNNEGGEGNQVMTRQVRITDKESREYTVNGISGDMFKHINALHLVNYCLNHRLPLSEYSKNLDPNRISSKELEAYIKENKKNNKTSSDIIDALVELCTVCDVHGMLLTDKVGDNKNSTNTPRKSIIEFGWTVGLPEKNNSETYLHTKLVTDAGEKGSATASNEGQNLFHRPANNGVYAFVCSMEVYRLGFNDISRKNVIDEKEREERYKALLQSLLNSFINPRGAMVSVQKPHITDFKGVVSVSYKLIPAPTISPINSDYRQEIRTITDNINRMEEEAIETCDFNSLSELSTILVNLSTLKPYSMEKL